MAVRPVNARIGPLNSLDEPPPEGMLSVRQWCGGRLRKDNVPGVERGHNSLEFDSP
jgi:hypothetical protein